MTDEIEDLDTQRAKAIAADEMYSKARLRQEFRMRPPVGLEPAKHYKGRFGWVELYRIADCVPMRKMGDPSPAQLKARQRLPLLAKLKSDQGRVSVKAGSWLEQEPLFLDTETTGLDGQAQIIEIAILNAAGQVLLSRRIKPSIEISEGAQDVHGISSADLESCPSWPEIAGEVERVLAGRMVVVFNSDYDTRLLKQTAAAYGDSIEWLSSCTFRCAMYLAASMYGATNRYGTISLINACLEAGVTWKGAAHSAEADTLATLDLVRAIAQFTIDIEAELEKI